MYVFYYQCFKVYTWVIQKVKKICFLYTIFPNRHVKPFVMAWNNFFYTIIKEVSCQSIKTTQGKLRGTTQIYLHFRSESHKAWAIWWMLENLLSKSIKIISIALCKHILSWNIYTPLKYRYNSSFEFRTMKF